MATLNLILKWKLMHIKTCKSVCHCVIEKLNKIKETIERWTKEKRSQKKTFHPHPQKFFTYKYEKLYSNQAPQFQIDPFSNESEVVCEQPLCNNFKEAVEKSCRCIVNNKKYALPLLSRLKMPIKNIAALNFEPLLHRPLASAITHCAVSLGEQHFIFIQLDLTMNLIYIVCIQQLIDQFYYYFKNFF